MSSVGDIHLTVPFLIPYGHFFLFYKITENKFKQNKMFLISNLKTRRIHGWFVVIRE
jgi:hypothetical protein